MDFKIKKLIYGKDNTKNIVGMYNDGQKVTLWCQDALGVTKTKHDSMLWRVYESPISDCIELSGSNELKYVCATNDKGVFKQQRQNARKSGIEFYEARDYEEMDMIRTGRTMYNGMKVSDLKVLSFDIETTGFNPKTTQLLIISNTFMDGNQLIRKTFNYKQYTTEGAMVAAWCNWVRTMDPSVLCGHNIFSFDIPYLNTKYKLTLGRDGSDIIEPKFDSKYRRDASQFYEYKNYKIVGREIIDTFFLAFKYDVGRKYNSYGLKNIIKQEGLEVEGRQHYDASKIRDVYKDEIEWQKILK